MSIVFFIFVLTNQYKMKNILSCIIFILIFALSNGFNHKYSKSQYKDKIINCTFKGYKLYGKIKIVSNFPDIKVKIVENFPDLKVKVVQNFPDECGKWQFVDNFPDLKVQFVESFPDIKIKFVENFPGIP